MTDPRYAPTTEEPADEPDERGVDDPFTEAVNQTKTDTHTAALQGAAAGGAGAGSGGYETGLLTGSEDDIGVGHVPEEDERRR